MKAPGRVFDIEADGLHPNKIHCMSFTNDEGDICTSTDYGNLRCHLKSNILVGHNIVRWDIPQLERILGIKVSGKKIDTLALSWYLFPDTHRHGLEYWGEYFGVEKIPIEDWEDLPQSVYEERCERDVEINVLLWEKCWAYLMKLYDSEEEALRLCFYLSWKMDCAREQEESGWKLDVGKCEELLTDLEREHSSKTEELRLNMPKVPVYKTKNKPKKMYKKSGELSSLGQGWIDFLVSNGIAVTWSDPVEYLVGHEEPNPGSSKQVKAWLYSLGWKPETFKYNRDKETGDVRRIEQINKQGGGGICDSIKILYEKEPSLELLDGLAVLAHRISILQGFLRDVDQFGWVQAKVDGLTNTLRWKHKVCVNLPGVDKPYGKEVRGCLIAPEGYELCGSDMSSLEDRTKQHYMWKHDPEYVKAMQEEGFDPHLDLACEAGLLTQEQVDAHKSGEADYSKERYTGKTANYACLYGAQAATVSRSAGITMEVAKSVVDAYARRNWAVQAVADECIVKVVNKKKWLYNPVSRFWYSLRKEKDRFSTLNQGTGVYCFDKWIKNIRRRRSQMTAQFHDEGVWCIRKGFREEATKLLRTALEEANNELKLNRELDIDIKFGNNYAEIH